MVVQVNTSLLLEPTRLSPKESGANGSCPAEKMENGAFLGSLKTQLKQNGEVHVAIPPQSGNSKKTDPAGLWAELKPRARRCAVKSLVLNVLLTIVVLSLIIFLVARPAKTCEPCLSGAACPAAACPEDWVRYRGKCYYFSEVEETWNNSQSHCSAFGASLAGIDTWQEMDFLMRYKGSFDHWIGLQREPGQPWKWTNGSEFNNLFPVGGKEHCAFLNHNDVGSTGCAEAGRWICSKPVQKPEGGVK